MVRAKAVAGAEADAGGASTILRGGDRARPVEGDGLRGRSVVIRIRILGIGRNLTLGLGSRIAEVREVARDSGDGAGGIVGSGCVGDCERRADETGVVGFDGQDAGGNRQYARLAHDQRRGSMVCGDADVLEDIRAEQEGLFIRVRVERPGRGRNTRESGKGIEQCRREVDGRLCDGQRTERGAKGGDVLALFKSSFYGVAGEHRADKGHFVGGVGRCTGDAGVRDHAGGVACAVVADHTRNPQHRGRGGRGGSVGNVDGGAEGSQIVEVALKVLKIEGEVENVVVAIGANGGLFRVEFGGEGESGDSGSSACQQGTPADDDLIEELCFLIRHVSFPWTARFER